MHTFNIALSPLLEHPQGSMCEGSHRGNWPILAFHPGAGSCSELIFPCCHTVRWSSQACSTQSSTEGFRWAEAMSPALTVAAQPVLHCLHPTAIRCLTAPVSEKQVSNGKGSSCVFQPCLSVMFEYLPESLSGVLENLCWKKQHRFSLTWLMSVHRVGAVSLLLDNMIYIWVKNNFLHRVHFVKWFFNKRASCERSLSKEFCTLYVILGQLYSYKPRPVFIDISYKLLWVTVTKPLFLTYMPQQRGCSSRDKQNSGQRCLLLRLAVNLLI